MLEKGTTLERKEDEELVEEYAEHNQGKYTSEFGNLYHAYPTGYKAGKASQWHDLRKNPR